MTSPLPRVQYLIAFQNGPLDDPALITSVASPGVLGGPNVWTDISSRVRGHTFQRGKQHELDQYQAGTLTLTDVDNHDAALNPWNTTGPYYGYLLPRKLIQVQVTWASTTYYRFTGNITGWPQKWPDNLSAYVDIAASDALRIFNNIDLVTQNYSALVLSDLSIGLAYYRLGDAIGSPAAQDLGPTSSSAAVVGTVTFGQAGLLPADIGTSALVKAGSYLAVPASIWNAGSGLTISCVIKTTNTNIAYIFDSGQDAFPHSWHTGVSGAGKAFVSAGGVTLVGATTINDGNPHQVVVAIHPTTYGISLYVDGALDDSTASYPTGTWPYVPSTIGAGLYLTNLDDITVQEFAIINYDLSAPAVAALYAISSWPQEQSGARINRVLNTVGWPAGARAIDAGSTTIQPAAASLATTTALAHLQAVEETEAGALYARGDGVVLFASRASLMSSTTYTYRAAIIGDSATEIPFQPGPTFGLDDADIYNQATGTRAGGVAQRFDDATSQADYGVITWSPAGGLLMTTDVEMLERLQWVIYHYRQPVTRLAAIKVELTDALQTPAMVASMLALELAWRVNVNRHAVPGAGSAFTSTSVIEGISEIVSVDSWEIQLALSAADVGVYWLAGYGAAGVTTFPGY